MVALASLTILCAGLGQARGSASPPNEARNGAGGDAQTSIIGGSATSIASYPWLAYVRYQGAVEESSCGGTVVSPRLVLTAAHCVLTGTGRVAVASNFSVLTGVADLREATPDRVSQVSQVVVFPEYGPSTALNDAALLVLAAPVAAPPLPLATPSDALLLTPGTPVAVAGWGLIDVKPRRAPAVLREAQSVVQATPYCQRKLRGVLSAYEPASQICVRSQPGRPGAGLCNGDSGGPAIARRPDGIAVQIGIVSLKGSLDCDPRSPQVLARVDRISSWVAAWASAIELGAPAPQVVIPKVELPRITRREAEVLAWLGLEADFGSRFTRGRYYGIECSRVNREKVKCRVQWLRGIDFYRGGITIYAALPQEGFVYNYRYTIRRFNANCWLTYLHPIQACHPRLFRR
ncbi:MAG TPA: trypsin-like serine protease [Solirubrobacterales bacterium]|nr:trypsin-like serine protease [Solirubrobacterales bacterium]